MPVFVQSQFNWIDIREPNKRVFLNVLLNHGFCHFMIYFTRQLDLKTKERIDIFI